MKKQTLLSALIALLILAASLTACGLIGGTGGQQITVDQLATMSAATISARLTQISIDNLVGQLTQMANATQTPNVTIITATPLPFTPVPTQTVPAIPTPVPPTPTAIPVPCNLASFVSDVSVKDGTSFTAGASFTKTWRIKNMGSCSWSKDYTIYFLSGNAMGAPASVNFPGTVKPGESVDISVGMVAPSSTGDFTGKWMFKSGSGNSFGVSFGENSPVTVVIKVTAIPTPKDTSTVYDFVGNMCKAEWRTNGGFITCPSGGLDTNLGLITRTFSPVLPSGVADDEGAIISVPAKGGDGMIQGQFPKMTLHSGDHFKASLFCTGGATKCSVTYTLVYKDANSSTTTTLGSWDVTLANDPAKVDIDLSSLDGKEAIFFLKVTSGGDSTNDIAAWMAARIDHP